MDGYQQRIDVSRTALTDIDKAYQNLMARYSEEVVKMAATNTKANQDTVSATATKLDEVRNQLDAARKDYDLARDQMQQWLLESTTQIEEDRVRDTERLQALLQAEKRKSAVAVAPQAAGLARVVTGVQGAQLNSIPAFSGVLPFDVEGWLEMIDRCKVQFGWDDWQVAAVVKNKLTAQASVWLRAQEKLENAGFDQWIGHAEGFKFQFEKKYLPAKTEQAAILAISNLSQKTQESCSDFFDRVVLAVDKVNHHITDEEKRQAGYRRTFETQVRTFFGAGLKQEVRQIVLGSNQPPVTMHDFRDQAVATEIQLSSRATMMKDLVAVESEPAVTATTDGAAGAAATLPPQPTMADLVQEIAALKVSMGQPRDFSNVTCYNCNEKGHFAPSCPKPSNRGRGGYHRGQQYRGRGRGRGNGSRGAYRGRSRGRPFQRRRDAYQHDVDFYDDDEFFDEDVYLAGMDRHYRSQDQGN